MNDTAQKKHLQYLHCRYSDALKSAAPRIPTRIHENFVVQLLFLSRVLLTLFDLIGVFNLIGIFVLSSQKWPEKKISSESFENSNHNVSRILVVKAADFNYYHIFHIFSIYSLEGRMKNLGCRGQHQCWIWIFSILRWMLPLRCWLMMHPGFP